jgi:ribosome modulation factor
MSLWLAVEYSEGWAACRDGIPLEENPYANSTEKKRSDWINGWTSSFDIKDDCNAEKTFAINW